MTEDNATSEVTKKTSQKRGNIPMDNTTFGVTSKRVSDAWASNTGLTLIWISQTNFAQKVAGFNSILNVRLTTGAARSPISNEMLQIDGTIDKNISYVKGYINDKYGKKAAQSHYAEFGIVKSGKVFIIPKDHDLRVQSLNLLLAALTNEGMTTQNYGVGFWTPIVNKYNELYALTSENISTVSAKVNSLESLRPEIHKVLIALINLIKANYPDTYLNVLREWGFQKELY